MVRLDDSDGSDDDDDNDAGDIDGFLSRSIANNEPEDELATAAVISVLNTTGVEQSTGNFLSENPTSALSSIETIATDSKQPLELLRDAGDHKDVTADVMLCNDLDYAAAAAAAREARDNAEEVLFAAIDEQDGSALAQALTSPHLPEDIASVVRCGESALHRACATSDDVGIVKLLLIHGANPHTQSEPAGNTALHLAAKCGHGHVARLLVEQCGVSILAIDALGMTALHVAAMCNQYDVVAFLLTAGGSIGFVAQMLAVRDHGGRMAHTVAHQHGIVSVLLLPVQMVVDSFSACGCGCVRRAFSLSDVSQSTCLHACMHHLQILSNHIRLR